MINRDGTARVNANDSRNGRVGHEIPSENHCNDIDIVASVVVPIVPYLVTTVYRVVMTMLMIVNHVWLVYIVWG